MKKKKKAGPIGASLNFFNRMHNLYVVIKRVSSPMRNIVSVILFCTVCLLFSACLETRTVEPPANNSSDWVSPTDYQILLENLISSINQRNTQNYLRCFNRDKFEYLPVASLAGFNESLWALWSIQEEQAYLENLINNLTGASGGLLQLEELDLQDQTGDSLRYLGAYDLEVRHADTTIPYRLRGQVQWTMKLNDFNEWEIHRWADIETSVDSSWSLLKLNYVQ